MYLGIDLGDKKCGIAIQVEGVIIPKTIITRPKLINYIKKLIIEYSITTIVIGLPYDLYGKKLKQLNKTKDFIEKLKNIFPNIKIDTIDERFTSFEAENILNEIGDNKKQGKIDDISAVLILESYIKQKNK